MDLILSLYEDAYSRVHINEYQSGSFHQMFGSTMLPSEQDSLHFGFEPSTYLIDQILRRKIQGPRNRKTLWCHMGMS